MQFLCIEHIKRDSQEFESLNLHNLRIFGEFYKLAVIVQIINRFRERKKAMGRAELIRVAQYQATQ
jgi:hypothetical protein